MASLNFNAAQVEPMAELEAVPAGKYTAVVIDSEIKATKAGTGRYLALTFEIVEGDYKGRKLWSRLNLENPNILAVQIARAELSSLCRAIGVMEPKDSVELHGIPMVLTVKQKADNDGEVRNEVKGYARRETPTATKPAQAPTATPPWRR